MHRYTWLDRFFDTHPVLFVVGIMIIGSALVSCCVASPMIWPHKSLRDKDKRV